MSVEKEIEERISRLTKNTKIKESLKKFQEIGIDMVSFSEKLEKVDPGIIDSYEEQEGLSGDLPNPQTPEGRKEIKQTKAVFRKMSSYLDKHSKEFYELAKRYKNKKFVHELVKDVVSDFSDKNPLAFFIDPLNSEIVNALEDTSIPEKLMHASPKLRNDLIKYCKENLQDLKKLDKYAYYSLIPVYEGDREGKENLETLKDIASCQSGEKLLERYSKSKAIAELVRFQRLLREDKEGLKGVLEIFEKSPEKLKEEDFEMFYDMITASSSGNKDFINDLKKLFSEKGSMKEKQESAALYSNLKSAGIEIDRPSLSKEWKKKAFDLVDDAIMSKYQTQKKFDFDDSFNLLEIKDINNSLKEGIENADTFSKEKGKIFPLNKEYSKIVVSGLKKKGNPVKQTEALVYGLISPLYRKTKDGGGKERVFMKTKPLKEALTYFEKEKLKDARKYVRGLGPNKIFSAIRKDLDVVKRNPASLGAIQSSANIRRYLKEEICTKGSAEKVEPISDMIASIEGEQLLMPRISSEKSDNFDYLLIKSQPCSVSDFFDNRRTMCCAFYPGGANREASLGYLKDPYIGLLQAKAAVKEGKKLKEIENSGVAITALCKDNQNKKVLLVDSVEGGRNLGRISENKWKEAYLNSIQSFAKDAGADYILFNENVNNSTPKSFNKYLVDNNIAQKSVDIEKLGDTKSKFYLEAFGGWNTPKGKVKGYVIELNHKK